MLFSLLNKTVFSQNTPTKKIIFTLFLVLLYRLCNTIPLTGIDQIALKQAFFQFDRNNSIMQIINMYSGGGGNTLLSPFSLGIIPYINASILIDLLTAIIPSLEKLQLEEGESGRRKLIFYKKVVTFIFSIIQSIFLLFYLKSYIYNTNFLNLFVIILQLTTGSMLIIWFSNLIDNKGIGNGTSILIFTNIVVTLVNKNFLSEQKIDLNFCIQLIILAILMFVICLSQTTRMKIEVVSARQLAYLEKSETYFVEKFEKQFQMRENGLSIRLNQAGIFPIIIASNIYPFFSYFVNNFFSNSLIKTLINPFYYFLIIGFNYFYTIVFWDPEKISEQLRKASVSITNITPGQETISYLENVVRSTSILGGIFLCCILFFFDILRQFLNGNFLNQLNISSLIILVGVAFEIQRTIRSLYKNVIQNSI